MSNHRLKSTAHRRRGSAAGALCASALIVGGVMTAQASLASSAQTASLCATANTTPVYETFNPVTKSTLLTRWKTESQTSASKYGYLENHGTPFAALTAPTTSNAVVGVHRLYKSGSGGFLYTPDRSEAVSAKAQGYVDDGVSFYATTTAIDPCEVGVHRLYNKQYDSFRNAVDGSDELKNIEAAGWVDQGINFYAANTTTVSSAATTTSTTTTTAVPPAANSGPGPLGQIGYVWQSRYNQAWNAYTTATDPSQKADDWQIANNATGIWLGYMTGIQKQIEVIEDAAVGQQKAPVIVLYGLPDVGCGNYATGAPSDAAYTQWVDGINAGLAGRPAILIVEPDAIGMCSGWTAEQKAARNADLAYAIKTLAQGDAAAYVYLHAGSESDPAVWSAQQLQAAGIAYARGFATNVSSFHNTASEIAWGVSVNASLAKAGVTGKQFVIDTSRAGATNTTGGCDLQDALIGARPTTHTANSQVDAYLWIQQPGHSDKCGNLAGDPGGWWQAYADLLVQNSLKAGTISAIPGP